MYSKQHKRKKLLTSISTILLSTVMLLTSINLQPLVSHAATGENGNLASLTGTVSYYPLGFNNSRQGYRFYVIDNTGQLVSKVVDFVYSSPLSCGLKPQNWYTNPRWSSLSNDRSNYEWYYIDELSNNFCAGADPNMHGYDITSPEMYPVHIETQAYVGAKFQHWFLGILGRGSEGVATGIPSNNIGNSTGTTTGSTTGTGNTTNTEEITGESPEENKYVYIDDPNDFYLSDIYTTETISKFRNNISAGESVVKAFSTINEAEEFINDSRYSNFEEILSNADTNLGHKLQLTYKSTYNAAMQLNWSSNLAKLNSAGCCLDRALDLGFDYKTAKAIAYLFYKDSFNAVICKSISTDNLLETNIPLSNINTNIPVSEINNDSTLQALEEAGINIDKLSDCLDIKIPLAEAEKTKYNYPIDRFLSKESIPENPYPFLVKGFNEDLSGNGSITLFDAFQYKENGKFKYGLVIEPIFWAGLYKDGRTYEPWYTYGTYYNILQYYVSKGWSGAGCHVGYMKGHGKNCMVVSKKPEFFNTGAFNITEATRSERMALTEILAEIEAGVGYGMHFYYAGDIEDSSSSTSTCDEPNSSIPNKSEDCSTFPEESNYPTTSKQVSIIKSYETVKSDGTIQNDGYFIRENCCHTITIEDEDKINYKVVDWQTSSESNLPYGLTESSSGGKNYTYEQLVSSSNKLQSGTSAGNTVILSETERILYVKLQKQEAPTVQNTRLTGDYILQESELAKAFQITPISIQYTFPKISFSESRGCGDHYNHRDTDGDGIDDDYDTCGGASSSSGYISDSKATVTIKNESESSYSNIIVQSDKAKFKSDMTVVELDRGTNADSFNTSANHKYTFNVYRYQQGEQNLTLCKYWQKQSSNKDVSVGTTQTIAAGNKDIAKTLGYSEANSKSTKSRADVDYIVNAVKFKFIFDTSSPDKSTSYYLHGDDCSCGDEHVGGYSRGKDIDTATTVESEADISVQVYSGTNSKPVHTKLWTETIGRNGEKYLLIRYSNANKTVGRQVQSTSTVKFNPFIKMTYSIVDDLKNNTIKKYPVNVLSEYQREILNTDYAEVAWQYQANSANLSLLSNMWSVDEVLTNNKDSWRQKNQVLKGGASAALQIKDSDMRALTLRTYQTVFPDSDINDYLTNATDYSVDKAVAEHDAFIQSAVDTFEQLHIVQRVSTRIEDSIDDMADENKVERGGNISFLNNNSNTASSDSKYYLSKDLSGLNAGADEGDLDVKLGSTSKKFFKVWSDTSGNILIAEGTDINALKNNISGTVILTKNQDSSSLTNQTAIDLNNRTFIVDKLINAVERNTGNDPTAEWVSDAKWYNESMAVYCMVQSTDIRLGFRDVNTRAFVLDAKLCPYLSSKSQQGKEAFSSIFSTDSFSEKWGSSEEGRVGTFKGKPIYMEDMQRLFTSKLFYIPNMTVQGSR